jgi:hypothetical protein
MTTRYSHSLRVLTGLLFAGTLAACASSHVLVGQARGSISPDQVRVYLRPPAQFEEIALVESSSRGAFAVTAQARMDKVIERLKKEAALLGANGIVIQNVADQSSGSVGTSFATATASGSTTNVVGTGIATTILSKNGSAIAIYVAPDALSRR